MKLEQPQNKAPQNATELKKIKPVVCYPENSVTKLNLEPYQEGRQGMKKVEQIIVAPREAECFNVPQGSFFRIISIEGSQVGNLNLWNVNNLKEHFYSGKTRAWNTPKHG